MKGRYLTAVLALVAASATVATVATVSACGSHSGSTATKDLHLDYAYYNPLSLVVRDQRLLENRGYNVTWVLSAGSNKANEGLRAKGLDSGSTAGSAALVARANGTPIKIIDVYSKPEWTALVVGKSSTINSVADLKGKKIAVTKAPIPTSFSCNRSPQPDFRRPTSKSSTCSTPTGKPPWSEAMWMPGPDWTRSWRRRCNSKVRACS